MDKYPLFDKIW